MTTNVIPFARTADQDITISSLEIAELTGKTHGNVMRDIRKMLNVLEESTDSYLISSRDAKGELRPLFALDRFHTEVLVTGYDIKRRAAVIQRWYDLEAGNATPWYEQKAEEPEATMTINVIPFARAANKDLTMSSLEIAELTGKQHRNVMADVRKMLKELEIQSADFSAHWIDGRGRKQEHFVLDHDHVMCLVTGYKVQLRMAVIQRLRALESGEATPWHEQQAQPQLPDFTNPAAAARAWADEVEAKRPA